MTHDEAVSLLTDYVAGRLNSETRDAVHAHLETCTECSGLVETIHLLAGRVPEDDSGRAPPAHLESTAIVEFALHRDALPRGRQRDIASHVEGCESCAREVQLVTRVEAEAAASEPGSVLAFDRPAVKSGWSSTWPRLALLAAAIGAAGTTYLGFYRLPLLRSELATLEREQSLPSVAPEPPQTPQADPTPAPGHPSAPGGLIRVQSLPTPRRSEGSGRPVITLAAEDRAIYLSIESPDLPGEGDRLWRFDLAGPDGTIVWQRDEAAAEIMRSTPKIVVAIPVEHLPYGPLKLRLRRADPDSPSLLEIPFVLKAGV